MTPIVSSTLLRTQSDARLAELARGGSERAFEAIVERYRKALGRYCARLVGETRAEDVVQDVFVKAWRALQDGPGVADLRPWLYRIAHNTSLNALRKGGYDYVELQESLRGSHAEPEAEQERRAVVLRTLTGLAALPDAQREALLRTALDGLSQDEVALELGLSAPAVRGLVYRAREALRAGATALTPPPVLSWLLGAGGSGSGTPRIAELVAGGGSAAGAGLLVKAGALLGAGAIAGGAVALKPLSPPDATPAASADAPAHVAAPRTAALRVPQSSDRSGIVEGRHDGGRGGDDHGSRHGDGSSGAGRGSSGPDDHGGSSGPSSGSGSSGGGDSGSHDSGSGFSGGGGDSTSSGSSGSSGGSSGSGSPDSGSGSSGSSGSDDSLLNTTSGSGTDGGGSGGSGSDSSGSGSSTSGSGSSSSGSSGSGSSDSDAAGVAGSGE